MCVLHNITQCAYTIRFLAPTAITLSCCTERHLGKPILRRETIPRFLKIKTRSQKKVDDTFIKAFNAWCISTLSDDQWLFSKPTFTSLYAMKQFCIIRFQIFMHDVMMHDYWILVLFPFYACKSKTSSNQELEFFLNEDCLVILTQPIVISGKSFFFKLITFFMMMKRTTENWKPTALRRGNNKFILSINNYHLLSWHGYC